MKLNTKMIAMLALFIALSAIGAHIKIAGSIAFDAVPAFLSTALLGPVAGAIVGFSGHMVSAMLAGFQFGIVVHLVIGLMMAITMIAYGKFRYTPQADWSMKRVLLSGVIGLLFNTVISCAALLLFLPFESIAGLFPLLFGASVANIVLAELIYAMLPSSIKQKIAK